MIKEPSLQMSIYEYLKFCDEERIIKGGGLITDKQSIFYSAIDPKDYSTHDNIGIKLENITHPQEQRKSWNAYRDNNIHIFTIFPTININLPENKQFSKSQFFFLEDILNQINQYIKQPNSKKIELTIFTKRKKDLTNENKSIEEIKKELREMVTSRFYPDEKEEIIGKTLDTNKIKSSILYHINFSNCHNYMDLKTILDSCIKYNKDKYYKNIFKEIFPNFDNIKKMFFLIEDMLYKDININNININNIEEKLHEIINNLFKSPKLYQLNNILTKFKTYYTDNKEINELFPNYNNLLHLINIIDDDKITELDKLLCKANNYEEVYNILMDVKKDILKEKANELIKNKNIIKVLKTIISQRKKIINNKKELQSIIIHNNNITKDLNKIEEELQKIDTNIEKETYNKELTNKELKRVTNNLFSFVANQRKIKKLEQAIKNYEFKLKSINLLKIELESHLDTQKDKLSYLKNQFYLLSGIETIPNDYSKLEIYENNINEDRLNRRIEELNEKNIIINNSISIVNDEIIEEENNHSKIHSKHK